MITKRHCLRTLIRISTAEGCGAQGMRVRVAEGGKSGSSAAGTVVVAQKSLLERYVKAPTRVAVKGARYAQVAARVAGQTPQILGSGLLGAAGVRFLFSAIINLSVGTGVPALVFLASALALGYNAYCAIVKKQGELAQKLANAKARADAIQGLQDAAKANADNIGEGVKAAQEKTKKLELMLEHIEGVARAADCELENDMERIREIIARAVKLEGNAGCAFAQRQEVLRRINLVQLLEVIRCVERNAQEGTFEGLESLEGLVTQLNNDYSRAEELNKQCVYGLAESAKAYQEALSIAIGAIESASESLQGILGQRSDELKTADLSASTLLMIQINQLQRNLAAAQEQTKVLQKELVEAQAMARDGLCWGQVIAGLAVTSAVSGFVGTVPAVVAGAAATYGAGHAGSVLRRVESAVRIQEAGPSAPAAIGPHGATLVFDSQSSGVVGRFRGRASRTVAELHLSIGDISYAVKVNFKEDSHIQAVDLKTLSDAMLVALDAGSLQADVCAEIINWMETVKVDRSHNLNSSSDSDSGETHVGLVSEGDFQLVKNKIEEVSSRSASVSTATVGVQEADDDFDPTD